MNHKLNFTYFGSAPFSEVYSTVEKIGRNRGTTKKFAEQADQVGKALCQSLRKGDHWKTC